MACIINSTVAALLLMLLLEVLLMMTTSNIATAADESRIRTQLLQQAGAAVRTNNNDNNNNNIEVAIEEMQRANYFTFVMLLRMAMMAPPAASPPPDLLQAAANLTFLMPNDKTLSHLNMTTFLFNDTTSIARFLLRHSIPSPLLFEQHLLHLPTTSTLPTSDPDSSFGLVLRITNQGRRSFFLNNVRISSPNICTRGSSITCHGIDGILQFADHQAPPAPSVPDYDRCPGPNSTTATAPPPSAPPPEDDHASPPAAGGGEADSRSGCSSSSSTPADSGLLQCATTLFYSCLLFLVLQLNIIN